MKKPTRHTTKVATANQSAAGLTALVKAFKQNRKVTYGGKGFGSAALKIKGKIFAMLSSKGQFVVKLPSVRVEELVQAGKGQHFEPKPGRLMKEWLVVKLPESHWLRLAREACKFVQRGAD